MIIQLYANYNFNTDSCATPKTEFLCNLIHLIRLGKINNMQMQEFTKNSHVRVVYCQYRPLRHSNTLLLYSIQTTDSWSCPARFSQNFCLIFLPTGKRKMTD